MIVTMSVKLQKSEAIESANWINASYESYFCVNEFLNLDTG